MRKQHNKTELTSQPSFTGSTVAFQEFLIKRYPKTVKDEDDHLKGYEYQFTAKEGIKKFIHFYNYDRPQYKYEAVAENIKERREELKEQTLERRKKLNTLREVVQP